MIAEHLEAPHGGFHWRCFHPFRQRRRVNHAECVTSQKKIHHHGGKKRALIFIGKNTADPAHLYAAFALGELRDHVKFARPTADKENSPATMKNGPFVFHLAWAKQRA